ncbi:MAG: hypothetical protein IK083_00560 [Abditibacteriota bacterium]|nr:hypothetical protein [Abditibacteriota bacterium]
MNAIPLEGSPLDLGLCFESGQAFGWECEGGWWRGVTSGRYFRLRVGDGCLLWEGLPEREDNEEYLRHYFRLDCDVSRIYSRLAEADPGLAPLIERWRGLRILRQPAEETFFSFMATACNNIPRIKAGLRELRELCGTPVAEAEGRVWKEFPSARVIGAQEEDRLTAIRGLAFRGRNMRRCAGSLPADFFPRLRSLDYPGARELLTGQPFIGPKLADCICLFGLDFQQAVPVDTHIHQIGVKYFGLPEAPLSARVYRQTAGAFRDRFGGLAGWAQQFLFLGEIGGDDGQTV